MNADRASCFFCVATIDSSDTVSLRIVSHRRGLTPTYETLRFQKSHPHYREVLEQIGPLAVGEEKIIRGAN